MKKIADIIKTHRILILSVATAAFLGACETPPPSQGSPEPQTSKNVTQDSARSSAAKTSEAGAAKGKTSGSKSHE